MTNQAESLIARSASHSEIVHAEYTKELHAVFATLCDDWCETNDGYDYWGDDESSDSTMSWRVMLHLPTED